LECNLHDGQLLNTKEILMKSKTIFQRTSPKKLQIKFIQNMEDTVLNPGMSFTHCSSCSQKSTKTHIVDPKRSESIRNIPAFPLQQSRN